MYKVIDLIDCTAEQFNDLTSAEAWAEFLVIKKNNNKKPINLIIANKENGFYRAYATKKKAFIKSDDITLGHEHRAIILQEHNFLFSEYVRKDNQARQDLDMLLLKQAV